MFYSSKVIITLLCSHLNASPKAAAWLLLSGDQAALLRRQTSGAAHSRADCQGVIRYRIACQASADTLIILCKE